MPTLNVLLTKLQHINTNHIGGVIASVIASITTHRGYELRLDQTKDYTIGLFCFSAKHAVFRSKSQEWLAQNQDNVSEWNYINTHELLFQWASTINKHVGIVQSGHHHHLEGYCFSRSSAYQWVRIVPLF